MKNTGCCKDEKKQFKLSSEQQKAEYAQKLSGAPVFLVAIPAAYLLPYRDLQNKYTYAQIHAPPLLLKNQTQSFLSIFLI